MKMKVFVTHSAFLATALTTLARADSVPEEVPGAAGRAGTPVADSVPEPAAEEDRGLLAKGRETLDFAEPSQALLDASFVPHAGAERVGAEELRQIQGYVLEREFTDSLAPMTDEPLVRPAVEYTTPDHVTVAEGPKLFGARSEAGRSSARAGGAGSNEVENFYIDPCLYELQDEDGNFLRRRELRFDPCAPPPPPPPSPTPPPIRYVRVYFLFTPEAFWGLFWPFFHQSTSGWIINRIVQAMSMAAAELTSETQGMISDTNNALANSDVRHRMQWAGIHSLTGLSETSIRNLYGYGASAVTTGAFGSSNVLNGIWENIHCTNVIQRRNNANADLVSVIVKLNDMGSGGSSARSLEYFDYPGSNASENAYLSVVKLAKSRVYFQFAHEVGHNMGLGHDLAVCYYCGIGAGRGYVAKQYGSDADPGFRTIMAYRDGCCNYAPGCNEYTDCPRIPHYSNPDVSYAGYPTGDTSASSASTLTQYMPQVSYWR